MSTNQAERIMVNGREVRIVPARGGRWLIRSWPGIRFLDPAGRWRIDGDEQEFDTEAAARAFALQHADQAAPVLFAPSAEQSSEVSGVNPRAGAAVSDTPLTVEEIADYAALLRDELRQAANVIEFLHCCLIDKQYKYRYPGQTVQALKRIDELTPKFAGCHHGRFREDCEKCQVALVQHQRRRRWSNESLSKLRELKGRVFP